MTTSIKMARDCVRWSSLSCVFPFCCLLKFSPWKGFACITFLLCGLCGSKRYCLKDIESWPQAQTLKWPKKKCILTCCPAWFYPTKERERDILSLFSRSLPYLKPLTSTTIPLQANMTHLKQSLGICIAWALKTAQGFTTCPPGPRELSLCLWMDALMDVAERCTSSQTLSLLSSGLREKEGRGEGAKKKKKKLKTESPLSAPENPVLQGHCENLGMP